MRKSIYQWSIQLMAVLSIQLMAALLKMALTTGTFQKFGKTRMKTPELQFVFKQRCRLDAFNFKACVRYFLKIHYTSDLITSMKLQ